MLVMGIKKMKRGGEEQYDDNGDEYVAVTVVVVV